MNVFSFVPFIGTVIAHEHWTLWNGLEFFHSLAVCRPISRPICGVRTMKLRPHTFHRHHHHNSLVHFRAYDLWKMRWFMALKCVLFQHILADMSLPLTLSLSFSLSYAYKHHTKAISRILSIFRSGFSFFEPHHLTLSLFLFPSVFHLISYFQTNHSFACIMRLHNG